MTDKGPPDGKPSRTGFSTENAMLLLGAVLPLAVSVAIVWMLAPDARWRAILLGAVVLLNAVWWLRLWARVRRKERSAVRSERTGG